eukprot:TRINITY_DN5398_c0_g1_i1.p1 TRINITY_DN5398_c0_g1~~TRINITY_DN5398_c0_g1_i1.p1  ORF type:complete len:272 (+),score=71.85 TRINITY_DN5398_c0_g1_i1:93-818(+)
MILVFGLRSVIDTRKWDAFNAAAWQDLLAPFGYHVDDRFYEEMLVSDADPEIHSALMPITPWDQFQALQKVRYRTLETCIAVAKPLEGHSSPFPLRAGLAEFLQSLPRSGPDRLYAYLVTNLPDALIRKVLERSDVSDIADSFDGVLESTAGSQTYRNFVSNIRQGAAGDDATQRPPKDSVVVSFETTAAGVALARKCGIKPIGLAVGTDTPTTLTSAGACVAVSTFCDLKPQYLPMIVSR